MENVKIKVVVQRKPDGVPGWPHINFNYDRKTEEIMKCVREYNPDADFDVVQYTNEQQAKDAYEEDCKKYDGVLVLLMTNWMYIDKFYAFKYAEDGKLPCAIAGVEYCGSGSILIASYRIKEFNLPVANISSGDNYDIARLARTLVVSGKLKRSTILVVKNSILEGDQEKATKRFGVKFVNKNSKDLMDIFDAVTEEEAAPVAEKWAKEALAVIEPSKADLIESARMYLAIRRMTQNVGADAVTIDCLTLSYNDHLGTNRHMYPCLSHFQMMDDGELGVCEADIDVTVACLIVQYMTGKKGFVSDPVIDTSSDQIIYAHCVACRKPFGPNDPRVCDYNIRSHAEDQLGASVQVIFPEGEPLTSITVRHREGWASIHSATSVGNAGGDAGCRSKLVAKCNAKKILENWMPLWHRATVFGDYRDDFIHFFKMKGLTIVEEDK